MKIDAWSNLCVLMSQSVLWDVERRVCVCVCVWKKAVASVVFFLSDRRKECVGLGLGLGFDFCLISFLPM